MDESYRFGIEEEFFLADATTRGTARRSLKAFHEAAAAELPSVERELLQAQVEIASEPTTRFAEGREALSALRAGLANIGRRYGVLVVASGTNPLARWTRQRQTQKDRCDTIMQDLQMLGRRDVAIHAVATGAFGVLSVLAGPEDGTRRLSPVRLGRDAPRRSTKPVPGAR